MRTRTLAALATLVLLVGGLVGVALVEERRGGVAVSPLWVSDTARGTGGNHHAAAPATVGGESLVYAPLSGRPGTEECELLALDGGTGDARWRAPVPPADCAIHAVADPTVADFDGDDVREVVVATTEREVVAFHPLTGAVEFREPLRSYGYTQPLVTDFHGDDSPELVVVDAEGTVTVFRPDGSRAWTRNFSTHTWGQPSVADFDGDGAPELAVGHGGAGELRVFEADGTSAWERPQTFAGPITWTATGQADADAPVEIAVAAGETGNVTLVDGTNGSVEWRRDFGTYAAVHAFADGDGDGASEVYVAAGDGRLRSVDAATGETEWTTRLTSADVRVSPPPALGDVDGDGAPELVAATGDGAVAVVAPDSGAVLGRYERDAAVYTHPRLGDLDGDGDLEAVVTYGYGRVVALDVA